MNRTRSRSGSKTSKRFHSSQTTHNIQQRNSSKKRSNPDKGDPNVTCWVDLLEQISKVTNKVSKLCNEQKKTQNCRSKAQTKGKLKIMIQNKNSFKEQISNCQNQIIEHKSKNNCNPDCHFLMYQCMKLNTENKKLIQEKEQLEKRLYYQSKEKRELRWKIQRDQKQKQRYLFPKEQPSHSFTLRYSDTNNMYGATAQNGLSQSSYLTAKRTTSPLRQRSSNIVDQKQNWQPKDEDSLLIDFSMQDESIKNTHKSSEKLSKTMKYLHFEKDLNELLQICKNETDRDKKKILRSQMKKLAEQIKSLKSE